MGNISCFDFTLLDFSRQPCSYTTTVGQMYEQSKLKMLRVYLCVKEKEDVTVLFVDHPLVRDNNETETSFEAVPINESFHASAPSSVTKVNFYFYHELHRNSIF